MDKPLDNYMKIAEFVRKEAREQATQVYNELGTKYNVAQVPTHMHNGTDSVQIEQKNIIQNNKNLTGLAVDTAETFTLIGLNLTNISRLAFFGFAANNADGSPATKRAIVNGETQFGRLFTFSGEGTGTIEVTTTAIGKPVASVSNSMYVDSTTLANNRVAFTAPDITYTIGLLVRVVDNTGAVVASLSIDSYTNNSLTLTSTLAANWKIQGGLTIT